MTESSNLSGPTIFNLCRTETCCVRLDISATLPTGSHGADAEYGRDPCAQNASLGFPFPGPAIPLRRSRRTGGEYPDVEPSHRMLHRSLATGSVLCSAGKTAANVIKSEGNTRHNVIYPPH